MRRTRKRAKAPAPPHEHALDVLDAAELREVIRDLVPELDGAVGARLVDQLIERAVRKGKGWAPEAPTGEAVAEVVAFAEAARRTGYAEPEAVDAFLRRGSEAFLRKDYTAAWQIFRALHPPLSEVEIHVGQDETVDEVLGTDTALCAARYLVSVYMTSAPDQRAEAVHAALGEVQGLGLYREPLDGMEHAAVEPLPGLGEFLPRWRAFLEKSADASRESEWLSEEDRWLREVVRRMEGTDGLARVARSTCLPEDLRDWCEALVEAGNWKAALSAFEEAAEVVRGGVHWRGEFLDGAALAAQELGRKDLPARLERAWHEAPSMVRLRRWLGSVGDERRIRKAASLAMEACPKEDECQRGVLDLVLGDRESAAKRLAVASGLGWSRAEHPGHVIFDLLNRLLGGRAQAFPSADPFAFRRLDFDELKELTAEPDEPRVRAPEFDEILEKAGTRKPIQGRSRAVVLAAMRTAAEKRIAGLVKERRRRHYDHAARLVAMCAALDPTSGTWVRRLRAKYGRYPALQRELEESLRKA